MTAGEVGMRKRAASCRGVPRLDRRGAQPSLRRSQDMDEFALLWLRALIADVACCRRRSASRTVIESSSPAVVPTSGARMEIRQTSQELMVLGGTHAAHS